MLDSWALLYFTLLYFTLLYFTLLYFTLLYFTLLYFTLLYFTLLYFTLLYFTLLYFTLLYFTLLYFTLLYFTLLYFTLLYFTLLELFWKKANNLHLEAPINSTKRNLNLSEFVFHPSRVKPSFAALKEKFTPEWPFIFFTPIKTLYKNMLFTKISASNER